MIDKLIDQLKTSELNPISGLDAAFLYIESPTSPMHIGSVGIIEGSLDFDAFRATILSRLHMIPKMRQRLLYVPFSIDYPYWVDDPNFDIDMHVHHIGLPEPGDWRALRKTAARIFSEPLNHSRPLWTFTFVEGLNNIPNVPKGSVAVISKMHHVAVDGMGGAGILSLLFDFSPEKKPIPDPQPYNPKPLPNELGVMLKSTLSFVEKPLKFPKLISEALMASFKTGMITRVKKAKLPTAPFTAPSTPINGLISPMRTWNSVTVELSRMKAMKRVMDTTLNDIILAICAGALRKYLKEKEQLPQNPLVAMVPISTRSGNGDNAEGNNLSSMLVRLATDIEDPIERLHTIHENAVREKIYQDAIGAATLANMAEAVPFGIANQAARLYSRFNISEMHQPVFNCTITNVPGPQFPLYLNGHKLHSIMGMAPIVDGMGLIITVFSYNGGMTISPTSDANSIPDLKVFTQHLTDSIDELEAALSKLKTHKKPKKPKSVKAESDALFTHVKKQLKANAEFIKPKNGIFQFNVTGDVPRVWKIDLDRSPGSITKTKPRNPDAVFTVSDQHLLRIGTGELNIQTAFIQGRLKISGDSTKAMKLGTILSKLPKLKL